MPSTRHAITASTAPTPNGNYSHCIRQTPNSSTLHICGFMGDDPSTGKVTGDIEAQTVQAIKNIKAVLEAAGSSLDKVVRRRIYIIDMTQFRVVDEVWGRWFEGPFPVSVSYFRLLLCICEMVFLC
jgi:2-iminobutanoate/2-iminopropanoate deaminase